MSDTERFYYAVQKHLSGKRKWEDLNPAEQYQFIQAINILLYICGS
jgi:hypothetical protein